MARAGKALGLSAVLAAQLARVGDRKSTGIERASEPSALKFQGSWPDPRRERLDPEGRIVPGDRLTGAEVDLSLIGYLDAICLSASGGRRHVSPH